jgi:5-deoxy-glucuronate isomerase
MNSIKKSTAHSKYHFKAGEFLTKKNPQDLGLEYTSVQRIEVSGKAAIDTKGEEACLAVMEGEAAFRCSDKEGKAVFKDMMYVPGGTKIELSSDRAVLIYFGAPSDRDADFVHIKFSDIDKNPQVHKIFGKSETSCKRDVWQFIGEDFNCSRLLAGFCEGSVGGWTVWPPHEHGDKREEVYVYFNMGKAFAVQCVYDDMENPYAVAMVRDGDLVSIPKGYHPNVGCPGGRISFIYCMVSKTAGDRDFMDLHVQEIFGDKLE